MMVQGGEDTDGAGSGGMVEGGDAGNAPVKIHDEAGSIEGADTDGAGTKGMVKKEDPDGRDISAPD